MGNMTNDVIDGMDTSENPALTSAINTQLNDRLLSEELEDSLKSQYMEFENLGYNFMADYDQNALTPEILNDMIDYIDNSYLGIEYKYQISDGDRNTYTLGPMLYEILFVDMVKFILPSMMKEINTRDISDIKKLEPNGKFKFTILSVIKNTLEGLQKAREIGGSNQKSANTVVKYSFCLDLFDADLEDFVENFIIPVCNNNDTLISNAL
jgi:hypothetical protein